MDQDEGDAEQALSIQDRKKLELCLGLWQQARFEKKPSDRKDLCKENVVIIKEQTSNMLTNNITSSATEHITLVAQQLCQDYIGERLTRYGICNEHYEPRMQDKEFAKVLQNIGQALESRYSWLYLNISAHLKVHLDNEILVRDSFSKFADSLFEDNISWAKIVAFYAFTAGLSAECSTCGKGDLLQKILYWFKDFFSQNLSSWIHRQGGWVSIYQLNNKFPCILVRVDGIRYPAHA